MTAKEMTKTPSSDHGTWKGDPEMLFDQIATFMTPRKWSPTLRRAFRFAVPLWPVYGVIWLFLAIIAALFIIACGLFNGAVDLVRNWP